MRPRLTPSLVLLIVALIVVMGLIAIPALAASPSPTPAGSTAASAEPSEDGDHDGNADRQKATDKVKKEHASEVAVTLSGTIGSTTTAEGETDYTLTVGSTTYTLDAGPGWYWKDKHPLKPYVGTSVTVIGEQEQGTTSVDVQSVDGKQIREPGRPPWAGGPMRVGKDHPGWSQDKADRWAARADAMKSKFGVDCWPPGHCKDASGKPKTQNRTATPTP